ncbi:MAG: AMP-binding protein [Clostridia bacterium]|nr:AMP-binding protein [Clostridia bacterium]
MKKRQQYELYSHPQVYTLKELLLSCSERFGEKPAFRFQRRKSEIVVSHLQFKNDVMALGSWLWKEGHQKCHVAVLGENSYEWILSHFAVTCGGSVIVPIDKELSGAEAVSLVRESDSTLLICSETYWDVAEQIREEIPQLTCVSMKEIPRCIEKGNELIQTGYADYQQVKISKEDLASIVYTSGTTGKSKGVMLTHENFATNSVATCCNVMIKGPSILLLPLHHTFGFVAGVTCVLYYGYHVYINSSLKRLMDDFQKAAPQHLSLVPLILETLYKRIWAAAAQQGKDKALKLLVGVSNILLKLKIDLRKKLFKSVLKAFGGNLETVISGGAPLDEKYVKGFHALGITIINGYGITECSPVVATNRNNALRNKTVGFPVCCNEVRIDQPDAQGNGEIMVRGSNVMIGYYRDQQSTDDALQDGWFRTGDIGRIDEDGYLYITGRIKNLIILANGENISAESIEQEVYTIPYVKECIVYGKEQLIAAEVFLDEEVPNARVSIHADIQKINQRLPRMKNIGKVIIRETEFPKTTTKKIKRNYGG